MSDVDDTLNSIEQRLQALASTNDGALPRLRSRVASSTVVAPRGWRWHRAPAIAIAALVPVAALGVAVAALVGQGPAGPRHNAPAASPKAVPLESPTSTFGQDPVFSSVTMADATHGWAVITGRSHTEVVTTTDAGRTWTARPIRGFDPVLEHFGDARSATVVALDDSDTACSPAFREHPALCPYRLFSTQDGGTTWQAQGNIFKIASPTSVSVVDAHHVWVVGLTSAQDANTTAIERTLDGGATWEQMPPISDADPGPPGAHPCSGGGPVSATFVDASTGWLTGSCTRPYLRVSHDGGATWADQALPQAPGEASAIRQLGTPVVLYLTDNLAFSGGRGSLVLKVGFTTGANALQYSALYRTSDGGRSWTATHLPATPATIDHVGSFWWLVGFGPDGNNSVRFTYVSQDDAASWHQLAAPLPNNGDILQFVSSSVGFSADLATRANPQTFAVTGDGGRTWSTFIPVRPLLP